MRANIRPRTPDEVAAAVLVFTGCGMGTGKWAVDFGAFAGAALSGTDGFVLGMAAFVFAVLGLLGRRWSSTRRGTPWN